MKIRARTQRGLSLVELMVGLALSLLLLGGLIQVFIDSRQAYRTNMGLSRVQENGRFALELLAEDIRPAGYKGSCGITAKINNLLDPTGPGYSPDLYDLNGALLGWDGTAPTGSYAGSLTGYRSNTDVILLKHAVSVSGVTAKGNTPANADTINLNSASQIKKSQIIVVADAEGCDIFQNRATDNSNSLTRGNTGEPGNLNPGSNNFSHAYDENMDILAFGSRVYYVGTGASGLPSLRRTRFDAGNSPVDEELVEGILDMQILYGVDTNPADNFDEADSYVTATNVTDWNNVVSVRLCVVAESTEGSAATGAVTVPCNGVNVAVPDNRLAEPFTTTIALRNRLQ